MTCCREREQPQLTNYATALLIWRDELRAVCRDRVEELLEGRHEVRLVENDERVNAQQPRLVRTHFA